MRVDFYLLESSEQQDRLLFACQLIEKAYLHGHSVFVFCKNKQESEDLDELLWTFKEECFIPHNLEGEGPQPPPPVHIGFCKEPKGFNDILLNLSDEIPFFSPNFRRMMELVSNEESAKEGSRSRFREYRQRNYELYTHKPVTQDG
jgi:DNA polymerase-3 subunit chi